MTEGFRDGTGEDPRFNSSEERPKQGRKLLIMALLNQLMFLQLLDFRKLKNIFGKLQVIQKSIAGAFIGTL
jgi:hypothetical protein